MFRVDIQCAGKSIEALTKFSGYDEEAFHSALGVAKWTIFHIQDSKGYFYYKIHPYGIKAKTRMLHWGAGYHVQGVDGIVPDDRVRPDYSLDRRFR